VLVQLRDPVERFHSGVWHAATHIGKVDADAINGAIARGRYGSQLQVLLKHFPREQVLVLQMERCRQDSTFMLAKTFSFLGLDPALAPARNVRWGPPVPVDPGLVAGLPSSYADDVRLLIDLVGDDIDLGLWPNFAHLG
jgi:hypothetical protein